MRLSIVSSSMRKLSNSQKIAHFLAARAQLVPAFDTVDVIDLADIPTSLWVTELFEHGSVSQTETLAKLKQQLAAADALIFVVPEWGGMACPNIKNLFLLCSAYELAHKPVLPVSVSSGSPKATPLCELRMSGFKNNRILYIPEQILVSHVENFLNDPTWQHKDYLVSRSDYSLEVLAAYAERLKGLADSCTIDHNSFPYGM